MKKKISFIFGTRPEAIKLAPLINKIKVEKRFTTEVCVTAQHRQMLDQVLSLFKIIPDVDLNLMTKGQTLGEFTAKAILTLDQYLIKSNPDLIIVQGDTTTVLSASLAAFYNKIPIAHVEAGLRTNNIMSPWPEEANRILTTRLAQWHFAPTENNRQNLINEHVNVDNILVTGNTVIDALLHVKRLTEIEKVDIPDLPGQGLNFLNNQRMVLITGHRRESFGDGFENICRAILALANKFPKVHFIFPVHLNPAVREPVLRLLGKGNHSHINIHLIEPVDYFKFVALMDRAYIILTDSGGVQEEAPSLGKPVLVMRETTERPEAVNAGAVKLVGTDYDNIISMTSDLITENELYFNMSKTINPYGDGHASERIVGFLNKNL